MSKGQSIIEVIVAVSIMMIIAASAVVAILSSFSSTRLAEEETQAAWLAAQGLEAVQSIRNQSWSSLTNGNHGLVPSGSLWIFSGTTDVDTSGKFTRVINIADVQRNSSGNIVTSGGTVDAESKRVKATVTWNFTPARSNSVDMTMYLTDWQKSRGTGGAGAPTFTTCSEYCQSLSFTAGTCRQNSQQCTNNNENYRPAGNVYCTGGANADTCCCN